MGLASLEEMTTSMLAMTMRVAEEKALEKDEVHANMNYK